MPILDSSILLKHGPFIEFASVPSFIGLEEGDWPSRNLYQEHIFFSLSDSLTGTLCSVTRTHMFFDIYEFFQYPTKEEIYDFASNMFLLASRLAACPTGYFQAELSLYEDSSIPDDQRTDAHLKADILETLNYVHSKIIEIARNGRCLVIVGI